MVFVEVSSREITMRNSNVVLMFLGCAVIGIQSCSISVEDAEPSAPLAKQSVAEQPGSGVPEVSTEELERILENQSAVVLDTRPHLEWSLSHIPGAVNVAPKPGVPIALYASDEKEVGRIVGGDKSQALVLYCNGPYCGKSKRVGAELLNTGYSNVRRYQLGAPVWRALVGIMEIEPDGVRHVFNNDQTAVWIDVRDPAEFSEGSISGARNLPRSLVLPEKDTGEVFAAKNDGRLPMQDHNTRIIVFGQTSEQASAVAKALAREAFHNVTYFAEPYAELNVSLSE
jgi:rhodanese-related sulfurtransferase